MEGRQNDRKTCFQRVETKKNQLRKMQVKAGQSIQTQTEEVKKLKILLRGLEGEARQTKDYCESTIVGVIDSLQSGLESLRQTIIAQQEEAAASGQRCLKSLRGKLRRLRRRKADLQRLAQMDDDAAFLQQWPRSERLYKSALSAPCDTWAEPHIQFELIKITVDEFGRQFKKLCEEEFLALTPSDQQEPERRSDRETGDDVQRDTSSPTIGLPQNHDDLTAEPRTREYFLQYACSLTFDVTTAHQELRVYARGRVVRLQSGTPPARRRPNRFMRRRQLLCRDALCAARCYYEVEVEGDRVEIALAYRGIDRKSLGKLSAFGENDKSWCLSRSSVYSFSHNSNSRTLQAEPVHQKVGVYLQHREGLLSFYEVADGMRLLHRVRVSFTQPLYPGFWLGENCRIRICDL
ncbi:uncharacterized protein LOC142895810 isoform X2 [Nelusetta ayraudi]|uniref:uncharacterized protein LOC142895810 isoform X2 n=1 Tax=Nelusetta ayraudi TaxID=303726 RepID=UPI003F6F7ED8